MMPTELSATFLTCVKVQCGPQNAAAITWTNTANLPLATEIDNFIMWLVISLYRFTVTVVGVWHFWHSPPLKAVNQRVYYKYDLS
jgi:hypothetical protein